MAFGQTAQNQGGLRFGGLVDGISFGQISALAYPVLPTPVMCTGCIKLASHNHKSRTSSLMNAFLWFIITIYGLRGSSMSGTVCAAAYAFLRVGEDTAIHMDAVEVYCNTACENENRRRTLPFPALPWRRNGKSPRGIALRIVNSKKRQRKPEQVQKRD